MVNKGTEDEANSVVGSYKYVSPEGIPIEVTYTAGVEGFRAYGAHLPVGPSPGSNIPKSLSFKNVGPSAFARPQFRASHSDSPTDAPAPLEVTTDNKSGPSLQSKISFSPSSIGTPTTEQAGQVAASNNVAEQQTQILFVNGREATERPLEIVQVSTASNEVEQPKTPLTDKPDYQQAQQSFFNQVPQEKYVSSTSAAPVQRQPEPVEKFEPPKSFAPVVPVLQTVPQAVQTQPKVVPVLQRVVPGYPQQLQQYQQQQQQYQLQQQQYQQQYMRYQQQLQQQQKFNTRPLLLPAYNQQQRPGSVRQYSVEPQQMWYMPHSQQGRYIQTPLMQRTLEPPKY